MRVFDARKKLPFKDKEFDLVISINTLHNFKIHDLKTSLSECERVGKKKYLVVEGYRNEDELFNLQCWALTCEFFSQKMNGNGFLTNLVIQETMSSYTSSRNFKAAVLIKQKQSLKIMDIKMPTYLDEHQVLVKIIYTGICGSQIGEIDGVKGKDNYLPHLLGHEGSAEVIKIGPKVKSLRKGDYVTLHWKPNDIKNAKPYVYSDGKIQSILVM